MAQQPNQPNPWQMAHMGLEFALAALVLGGIGFYADYRFNSFPYGTLIGLVLGLAGGTYRFLREAVLANRRNMRGYEQAHQQRLRREAEAEQQRQAPPEEADEDRPNDGPEHRSEEDTRL